MHLISASVKSDLTVVNHWTIPQNASTKVKPDRMNHAELNNRTPNKSDFYGLTISWFGNISLRWVWQNCAKLLLFWLSNNHQLHPNQQQRPTRFPLRRWRFSCHSLALLLLLLLPFINYATQTGHTQPDTPCRAICRANETGPYVIQCVRRLVRRYYRSYHSLLYSTSLLRYRVAMLLMYSVLCGLRQLF